METKMHMYLATTEKGIISEELYKGHCSEWIDTFRGCGSRVEYDILKDYCKSHWGNFPECKFTKKENVYFGHHAITVKDYIDWYHKYKPYLDAGWVRKYDAWCYNHKGIIPELIYHHLPACPIEDVEWIEINDNNCPDTYIYKKICEFLNNNYDFVFKDQIPEDLYLIWCFND